ncbi:MULTISPECIES: Nif3-like dinuclear metal center hexameric protein [unclassified Adlercreutzia]|uniref:Nif3-like dinuclear metal center hexameric protein n=1 Tax=unclassified Adlercreutzia TaxID=2636013 RepID=UPI0013EB593E|nr:MULTISPECIES: Nif3-like dinuclear metal center hexameric protein [unclassified Adlercreutzia]
MALFNRKDPQGTSPGEEASKRGALVKRPARAIAKAAPTFTVGSLEAALLKEFPAQDAEEWDRMGLLVGEAALPVERVAVALDPTVAAIREAARGGANVLVTHHPAFLAPPTSFSPESSVAASPGAGVWAAIQNRVALMDFHTALDVSPQAARVLPSMLGLAFTGRFVEPLPGSRRKGYGQICDVPAEDGGPHTLAQLAARCTAVFGRAPRVWGEFDRPLRTVVTATGSAGTCGRAALAAGADCLVCGEVKYHEALDLSGADLAIIELGHDVSELPLVAVLAEALARVGVAKDAIMVIDQSGNWATPEALRV